MPKRRPKSKPKPVAVVKADDLSKLSEVGLSDDGRASDWPTDNSTPVLTRTEIIDKQIVESSRIGILSITFALGLALGVGLGVLTCKYYNFVETKVVKDHCGQFKSSLDAETLATEQIAGGESVVDDVSSPGYVKAETFQNIPPRDPENDVGLKSQKIEFTNFEGVNLKEVSEKSYSRSADELGFQKKQDQIIYEESIIVGKESYQTNDHLRENRPTNWPMPDDYQENELKESNKEDKKDSKDRPNKGHQHQFEAESATNLEASTPQILKTITFKDGKLQDKKTTDKKSSSQKLTTPEFKMKESNKNDEIKNLKAAAVSHTPTYLQRLKVRNVRVGGNVVTPQELTNGTAPIRAYIYENFLTPKECEGLMGVHNRHVIESNKDHPIVCFDGISTLRKHLKAAKSKYKVSQRDFTNGTTCVNVTFSKKLKKLLKWSYSTAFYPGESKFSTIFEQRVLEATGLKPENGGKFQITSYQEGIGYKTHTDCTIGSAEKRDRVATILVYLQDVDEGGETKFPELNISVRPVRGRALVWNNMNSAGDCQPLSLHEAAQVKKGHKYILQRWYYYESFYHLGKRPSEPNLPDRNVGQPRVSCDEYENGSCRWYDEWNYDHIIDYRSSKSSLL
ncbi:uncharacterized protein LOC117106042 [Anneissia japonica]|uniref:uncharacterized protein LOC117106042 n=1 Tax=Anneissia japonica TaxID=1529436 RepID=UPI0014258748|nr:uncharacterized protein LOC117106042 [Anneissia japonica]